MTDREMALLWLKSFAKNKEPMTLIPKQLIRLMYNALTEQPDIVRCKDCKYGAKLNNAKGEPMIECGLMYGDAWLKDPDWFCADGKRK